MFAGPIVIVALLAAVFTAVVVQQNYRQRAVAALAERMGLTFLPTAHLLHLVDDFEMASQGTGRTIRNCMEGEASGIEFKLFEFCYSRGAGRHRVPMSNTVAYLTSEDFCLPVCSMHPNGVFSQAHQGELVYVSAEFNKKFLVNAADSEFVRQVFDEPLTDHLRSHSWWSFECNGKSVIVYGNNHTVAATQLEQFLKDSLKLVLMLRANTEKTASGSYVKPEPAIVVGEDGRLKLARRQ